MTTDTAAPGIAALRSDVAALTDELRGLRGDVATVDGKLDRVRDELAVLATMSAQLDYLHGAGMKLSELSEQLGPMLDGLAGNPLLRGLVGGR